MVVGDDGDLVHVVGVREEERACGSREVLLNGGEVTFEGVLLLPHEGTFVLTLRGCGKGRGHVASRNYNIGGGKVTTVRPAAAIDKGGGSMRGEGGAVVGGVCAYREG
jgi:hypothetical protein